MVSEISQGFIDHLGLIGNEKDEIARPQVLPPTSTRWHGTAAQ